VTMAEVELLGLPAGLADERVVGRHATVVMQTDHGPGVVVRPLRAIPVAALAEGEIEIAGAVEDDAPAEMVAAPAFRVLGKESLHVLQAIALQLAARQLGAEAVAAARRVGEIDERVLRELRMQ